jgi:hypothetical protein
LGSWGVRGIGDKDIGSWRDKEIRGNLFLLKILSPHFLSYFSLRQGGGEWIYT